MAKDHGVIGFAVQVETYPGVYEDSIEEKSYSWYYVRPTANRYTPGSSIHDDIVMSTQISVVINPFLKEHKAYARYVEIDGVKWKITAVEPELDRPRYRITLGEVYHDDQGREETDPSSEVSGDPWNN